MTAKAIAPVADWIAEAQRLVFQHGGRAFYDVVLDVAVRRLSASGGAVWSASNGQLEVVAQVGVGSERIDHFHQRWPGHSALLERIRDDGRPQVIKARLDRPPAGSNPDHAPSIPLVLAVAPINRKDDGGPRILELFHTACSESFAAEEMLASLSGFCRGVAELEFPGGAPAQLLPQELADFSRLCAAVHESLDLEATAATIVNQVRTWLHCSRVSLLRRSGRRCRLLAISELDHFDRRSEAVRTLEGLAAQVVRDGRPYLQDGCASSGATAARDGAAGDEDRPWLFGVVPLPPGESQPRSRAGALVVEEFDESAAWTVERRARLDLAAVQAAAAFENALRHESVPLHGLGRCLQRLGWKGAGVRVARWFGVAAVVAALVAVLALVETDFDVSGRGTLLPAMQRDVFARTDGIVDELLVQHGDSVAVNDALVRLRSPELEQQRAQLEGQRRTTEQQIADLAALRGGRDPGVEARPTSQAEMAARREELNSVLASVEGQLAALARQEQELTIVSPIAGRVLTWNVEQLLAGRPVHAGQRLLAVADVEGPWIAELRIPDRDIVHVQAAGRDGAAVRVSLLAATDLKTSRVGTVSEIAQVVTQDPLEGPVVVVTVALGPQQDFLPRPGATVYPRIHCGRRCVGYVWFRRLYETVASWVAL